MQISERLRAVAALVTAGGAVADIGTDHAYIPIYLIRTGATARAIAMDVNPGPLARAREHIAQYALETSIETRLSDGLTALRSGEADSVVIAGMGGPLMARILEEGRDKLGGCRELILQPQSEIRLVRAWLDRNGWQIVCEDMVCEDGKYYPMMRAERRPENAHGSCEWPADASLEEKNEMELRFGPVLLRDRHPVLREFLLHEKTLDRRILRSLEGQQGEAALQRAEEIRLELQLVEKALAGFR